MKLESYQINKLQNLLAHEDFPVLQLFAELLKAEIGSTPVFAPTEWEFSKNSIEKETKIKFINEFFDRLEREAAGAGE